MQYAKLISGSKSWYGRQLMYYHIARQALALYRSPGDFVKALKQLLAFQREVNGTSLITKFVRQGKLWYWTPEYPGFPSTRFNTLISSEFPVAGKLIRRNTPPRPILKTVVWAITNRCPLTCTHCYEWENIHVKDTLNMAELQQILSVFRKNHLQHIQLSGGEPLARYDDLLLLVKEASETMDTWLLTSGFGLTAERALQMKRNGLTGVHISLDHWDRERNNRFRNHPQAFEKAKEAVAHSLEAGLLVSLSLCVVRDFATEEHLMKYAALVREMGVHFIRILEPRATGRLSGREVHPGREQLKIISDFAIRMNSEPAFRGFPIVEFLGYHQQKMPCFGAGNRFLYVDPNGDVHACPFCRGVQGNLLREPVEEILVNTKAAGCPFEKLKGKSTP